MEDSINMQNITSYFKIFKPTVLYIVGIFMLLIVGAQNINAQAVGDYGTSINTGASTNWNTAGNWLVCTSVGTWTGATVATAVPTSAKNVWIRTGALYAANGAPVCLNLNISTGATLTVANVSLTVSGTTTVNGAITFTSTTGTKTMGNVVIAGGTWTSNSGEAYGITNLTLSGSTINGSNTGIFNVSGAMLISSATTNTLNNLTITVLGTSTVQGSLIFANATGTKTFADVVISGGGTWTSNGIESYPVTNLTLSGSTINGSASGTFTVSGNLVVSASTTNTLNNLILTVTGTTTVDGTFNIASTLGSKSFRGATTINSSGV